MEFHHLGSHCNFPDCKQLDFLPFKCSACDGTYCLDHRTYEGHNCRNAENTDRRAIICPMCNMPIVPLPNQDPNLVLDDHINQGCIVKASQSFKCNMKGCKKVDVLPMVCKLCRRHHCVRHRFESDHNCPRKPQPAKKAPTPTPANPAKPISPPNNHPTSTTNNNNNNNINRNNNINNNYNNNQHRNNQNAGHVPNNANVYPSNMQPPSRAPLIETTIGVRLTNGEQLRHTCTIGTTLRELQVFIDQNRTDGAGPYKMRTTYPARELSYSDLDKTLSQLSLVPSGMIILQPFEFEERAASTTSPAPNGSTSTDNSWWGAFSSFFTSFLPTSTQQQ